MIHVNLILVIMHNGLHRCRGRSPLRPAKRVGISIYSGRWGQRPLQDIVYSDV